MTRLKYTFAMTAIAGMVAGGLLTPVAKAQDGSGMKAPEATAAAPGPGVAVTISGSVSQTVSKLKKMVASNGMMVMGQLNQGQVLSMTGINVQSETLFVGNPQIGKKLFSANPGAGVVVPVRINVYQDTDGKTVVRYVPPSQELDKFHNSEITQIGQMLDKKLKDMTSMLGQ
jgi:uncharacterized protein (DUF302 family)